MPLSIFVLSGFEIIYSQNKLYNQTVVYELKYLHRIRNPH